MGQRFVGGISGARAGTQNANWSIDDQGNANFAGTVQALSFPGTAAFTNITATGVVTAASEALSGKITTYNGVVTAGNGVLAIVAAGRTVGAVAAVTSVATYTVGAADSSFIITGNVLVTTSTTHSFTLVVGYTDEGGTVRSAPISYTVGTNFTTTIVQGGGAIAYPGFPIQIRAKAATAITIATTGTFTAVVYNVEGTISQVS